MTIVLSENFDSVTTPVVPSDIRITSGGAPVTFTTTTLYSLSSPNSLLFNPTSGNPYAVIFPTTPDSTNGNCTVSCSFYFPTVVPSGTAFYGLVINIGNNNTVPTVDLGNTSYFVSFWNASSIPFQILRTTGGSTTFYNPTNTLTFSTATWYTLTFTRNGSYLWFSCSYTSAGTTFWATIGGTWQNGSTTGYVPYFTAYHDVTPLPSSPSYGGVFLQSTSTIAIDNLVFQSVATNQPTGPLKGMMVFAAYNAGITTEQASWNEIITGGFSSSHLRQQIDLALTVGCNALRSGSGLVGVASGLFTMAQYQNAIAQAVSYAKSKGLWWSHVEDEMGCPAGTTQTTLFPAIASYRQSIAQTLSVFPNVIGFDMMNEFDFQGKLVPFSSVNFTMTAAQWDSLFNQMIAAIRTVAPGLPLTASIANEGSTFTMNPSSYQFDYMEIHIYGFSPTAGQSAGVYTATPGTVGKPFYVGECGGPVGQTPTRAAQLSAIWTNVVQASYAGQPGCIGASWFCAIYDGEGVYPTTGDQMWLDTSGGPPFTIQADVGPTFSGFTVPSYFFGSGGRRRRR